MTQQSRRETETMTKYLHILLLTEQQRETDKKQKTYNGNKVKKYLFGKYSNNNIYKTNTDHK